MEDNVTPKAKEILENASKEAKAFEYKKLDPEHIVMAILRDNANICVDVMHIMGVDIEGLFDMFSDYLNSNNLNPVIQVGVAGKIPPSENTKEVLKKSLDISKAWGSNNIDVEHILLSILTVDCQAKKILAQKDVTPFTFPVALKNKSINKKINMKEYDEQDPDLSNLKKKNDSDTPVLDNFCRDLTKMAEEGKIDTIIGRDAEIKRVSQILSRKKNDNPILIGEPGVGKTAIIEGLAKLIAEDKCPTSLMGKRIYNLDLSSIIAGTKYRGQFEGRMKAIIEELTNHKEVILFIDEIHTIIGAGNASGSLDVSNILKPALARGELQIIGATTLKEFRESIEKDGALSRRFLQVLVKEPSLVETFTILNNIKGTYEKHHRVTYSDEIIEECVKLADRYIADKFMPDKAIDIMDECGAATNTDLVKPDNITKLEQRIIELGIEKDVVVQKQQYEDAVRIRNEEYVVQKELTETKELWLESLNLTKVDITIDMVNSVVSLMTGIPLEKLSDNDNTKLISLENELNKKVIGQEKVVSVISKSIRRNKLGLRDKNKPQGSYIFLGKSGSGKTFLSKIIAEYIFNDKNALIRVDMSEYMEKFSVSSLIGAPPGYVGFDEGGKLTEAVRRKPYSVILFDEIEKAHPDVFNILLQVLDEGYLTDSSGVKVNFKNTLIILTSNVGVREMGDFGSSIGFGDNSTEDINKQNEATLKKAVKKKFSPEFLNRVDDVLIFNELSKENIIKIVELEIKNLRVRIKEMGYDIKVSKTALGFLADKGYDKDYGARPLARKIQELVEDEIADKILSEDIKFGDTISVGYNKKTDKLTFK